MYCMLVAFSDKTSYILHDYIEQNISLLKKTLSLKTLVINDKKSPLIDPLFHLIKFYKIVKELKCKKITLIFISFMCRDER